jgi:type IV secretory pathway VirB10-like protein
VAPTPAPLPASEPTDRVSEPVYEEIVLPSTSVIGLELETSLTSERARVEDRVDARVTRDVYAAGRLAIPAGSRVIGAVTLVERGGKVKERARLGVRFHTLVLAGGRQVDLRTETIYREGESPANDSSKKIGGAAIGGAVLGAILGGGKGAIAGGAAGAAGGTAVVMAGDRKPATLPVGSVVTVKLSAPVTLEVER